MQQTHGQAQKATEIELRALLSSTEDLIQAVGDSGGEAVEAVKARLQATIERIRSQLGDPLESASKVAKRARDFVSERPWTALGIGAAVGVGLGLTLFGGFQSSRRRSRSWSNYFTH